MIHILLNLCKRRFCRLGICSLVLLISLLTSCTDTEEQYERPSWLEPPIYDVLLGKGNFSMYLQAVDKTLYSSILKGAGNYTVFAPNDDAFRSFLSEHNYASISEVPVDVLTQIVAYSMVFNRFESFRLGNVLVSSVWEEGTSIKKRSSYYKTLYKEEIDGVEQWVVDSPSDVTAVVTPYKFLPVFTESYFNNNGLKEEDYQKFFPNNIYSGLNAAGGNVLVKDIYAENGIIHEVDAVNLPLDNLDEMLKSNEHEAFRKILETKVGGSYLFVSYLLGENTTEVYKKLYPERDISAVYCKTYQNLPYLLNNEDYKGTETATTEQQGYTLFVPSNESVEKFSAMLCERAEVGELSELSLTALTYFLKAHMVPRIIWPSGFVSEQNSNEEFLNGAGKDGPSFEDCVTRSNFASNGVLYDTKDVVESKYFTTVYSEILLNKDCRNLSNVAYEKFFVKDWIPELTKSRLTGDKETDYIMVLPSDELLKEDGFVYDEINKKFLNEYASIVGASAEDRMKRLLRSCIFKRTKGETELNDFSGFPDLPYDGYGYAVNSYGDIIRFKDNKLQGLGNILDGTEVEVEKVDFEYINGRVFRITNGQMIEYSQRRTGSGAVAFASPKLYDRITEYVARNSDCKLFKEYMDRFYGGVSPSFIRESTNYTVLIPSDEAIEKAVSADLLPPLPAGTNPFASEDRAVVERFIQLCFLTGTVVPDDGMPYIEPGKNESLALNTVYKLTDSELDLWLVNTAVVAFKVPGTNALSFRFQDIKKNDWLQVEGYPAVNVLREFDKSNYMGPLSVIHAVDGIIGFTTHPNENN